MSQPLPHLEPARARQAWRWMARSRRGRPARGGAAAWALLAGSSEPPGNPAAADPKGNRLQRFFLVSKGVALQSRKDLGPEPAAQDAVAANARLSMAGGAAYLRDTVPSNTPRSWPNH